MQQLWKLKNELGTAIPELLLIAFVLGQINFTEFSIINVLARIIFTIWIVLASIKYLLILNDRIREKNVR